MKRLTQDTLRGVALEFQRSRILLTAYELGLFTALGKEKKTARGVSRILRTDAPATERLMNALCTFGLLRKINEKFFNTPLSLRFLVKSSPHFMAGLMHVVHMWDAWSTLTQAVRKGKSVLITRPDKRGKEWLTAFIAAMHERAQQQAENVISLLDLSGVSEVLDAGGGSGAYAMAFVRAKEGIKATVFDLPQVTALTRRYVKKECLLNRIKIVSGDYSADKLGRGFDLVFLSAIVHSNSSLENRALVDKCVKALSPGGQLVIQDFIMDEDKTAPAFGALFSLNMLVATESGDTYTESEVKEWLQRAGLSGIQRLVTDFDTSLIIGRKTNSLAP